MEQDKIYKIILWVTLGGFGLLGLMEIFPYIKYVLIILGISIPAYILYNKYKKENDE